MTRIVLLSLVILSGCAATRLETDYGNAYRLARDQQVMNPAAGQETAPVTGLDGTAAEAVLQARKGALAKPADQSSAFSMTPMALGSGK